MFERQTPPCYSPVCHWITLDWTVFIFCRTFCLIFTGMISLFLKHPVGGSSTIKHLTANDCFIVIVMNVTIKHLKLKTTRLEHNARTFPSSSKKLTGKTIQPELIWTVLQSDLSKKCFCCCYCGRTQTSHTDGSFPHIKSYLRCYFTEAVWFWSSSNVWPPSTLNWVWWENGGAANVKTRHDVYTLALSLEGRKRRVTGVRRFYFSQVLPAQYVTVMSVR